MTRNLTVTMQRWSAAFAVGLACAACGRGELKTPATETPAQPQVAAPLTASEPVRERYALDEAARDGLVEYEVSGLGGSSGDSLLLSIRRTSAQSFTVYVAPGTVFGTSAAGVQSMIAYGISGALINADTGEMEVVQELPLVDVNTHRLYVEAYCLDFHLENPAPENRFTIAAAEPRASLVLNAAKDSELSVSATQAAIWMDRDHVTKEDITAKFEASDQDLEDAWQLLKKLPPP